MGSATCKYKDMFGSPGEGVHRFRLGGVAVVDYVLTILLALLTSVVSGVPWTLTTVFWILAAMLLHAVFCVDTSVFRYFSV
jgi:hypothetical protein